MSLNESIIRQLERRYNHEVDNLRELESEANIFQKGLLEKINGRDFWQISEDEFSFLYIAVKISRPKIVFETGVGPGTSTSAILKALGSSSRLVSFDLGVKYGNADEMPVGFVIPQELKSKWELILGDSAKTLKEQLSKYGKIDMFFHDSTHTYEHVTFELNSILPHLSDNFIIVIDNYDWTSAPKDFAKNNNFTLVHVSDDMCFMID